MSGMMMEKGGMMGKDDKKELMAHLKNHVMYPANKRTIVEMCNNMEHVPSETRSWVEQKLPEGNYKTADDVVRSLGL
jgi:hypothetical protein